MPRDAARSARLFAKAAALSNHPSALNGLGYCVSDGRGCARDAALAARLFRRAADQGDADAQYNLGVARLRTSDLRALAGTTSASSTRRATASTPT